MLTKNDIQDFNKGFIQNHESEFKYLSDHLGRQGFDVEELIKKVQQFQIAIPSWALGAGGTRFGRFSQGGEPRNLEEKIRDVGLVHSLNQSSNSISLHIPWDIPEDADATLSLAKSLDLHFDAVNSNTFQDQPDARHSYKYGSLSDVNASIRDQAVAHNIEVIEYGKNLGSKALTVWLADGSSFPGQNNLRRALERTEDSLSKIYAQLPEDWKMFIEYKPYEPHFYSMVIPDWGTSMLLANKLGSKAFSLVDLGHHLPNTNIEQIVAVLMKENKLGGFHFNDSKYGDDDLTSGAIKPYQLFLIFNELVDGFQNTNNPNLAWMIDASHNLKDPLEDLMQSVEAIKMSYAQALIVDRQSLTEAQETNDVTRAQSILQKSFRTDVSPLIKEAALRGGGALSPVDCYRHYQCRKQLTTLRGAKTQSTGL